MTRKIEKGKPITELTKGSLEYTIYTIRDAFYAQFPRRGDDWFYVEEIFSDHLIVSHEQLPRDEYYMVGYAREGAQISFTPRDKWEVVELTYATRSAISESASRKEFSERLAFELIEDAEKPNEAGPWRVRGIGSTANIVNANGRRRKTHVMENAVRAVQQKLVESLKTGRMSVTGESDHPTDKGFQSALFSETIVVWDKVEFDGQHILIEGNLLPTREGRDAYIRMKAGVKPDISQRSYGRSIVIEEDGAEVEEVLEEDIRGYDFVNGGADRASYAEFAESQSRPDKNLPKPSQSGPNTNPTEVHKMNLEELRKQYPELVAQIEAEQDQRQRQLLEAQLKTRAEEDKRTAEAIKGNETAIRQAMGLEEGADLIQAIRQQREDVEALAKSSKEAAERLAAYEEAERLQKVADHVAAKINGLNYPDEVKTILVDSVKASAPATIEDADKVIALKQKEYDALMAQSELGKRGKTAKVTAVAPVLETELGVPAFAEASHEFRQRLVERELVHTRNLKKIDSPNARFTVQYLDHFDKAYFDQLQEETRKLKQWQEAESTSDLNLPYSVSRAIIEEAFPELVALSLFDFGFIDASPTKLFFEAYSAESGATPSVTNEDVVADLDDWVQMANKRLIAGTVVVEPNGGGTAFVEYTDYLIDYANGRFMALSTGSITNGVTLDVDYTYNLVRGGEGAAIQRGKGGLTSQTIEALADRLAAQITDEAMTFARTQLGWDAQTRTMMLIVREIREMIDSGVIRLGLAQAIRAGNSGGVWNHSGSEAVGNLVAKLGAAATAVEVDNYMASFFLLSTTNADLLSNWDGFKRDGFPDAVLNSTGFVGRVKGKPVFKSNQMPDTHALTGHRELVQHRVLSGKPMTIKGPFPSYDSNGRLIASDQYYAEEYNVTESFIKEKGGYVTIT